MVSGSSLTAYWLGHYLGDIVFQAIPSIVAMIGIQAFGIEVPHAWVLFLVNTFTNPPFIYFLSFLFEKDESGSSFVKMIYIVFGIIAPIAISILQVVDKTTQDVGDVLRWFFYPVPIFSLTFGYISIANRAII